MRHDDWGFRQVILDLRVRKSRCRDCGRTFRQQLPGIQPFQRASESFQEMVFQQHLDGINRSCLGRRKGIAAASVQRYFLRRLQRQARQDHPPECPKVLGIDEHFFTRKKGYATTLCDLKNHRIYDVTLGRSEASLEAYLHHLKGKERVRILCMDLAAVYRSIARKHFPKAVIVADRFHVIRLINHHFLACWRDIDPVGAKHRGLLSLMRRHRHNLKPEQRVLLMAYLAERPALELIYAFKQRLCSMLLKKHRTRKQCRKLVPRFLRAIVDLRQSGLAQLVTLGDTLHSWSAEIARMWRFTRRIPQLRKLPAARAGVMFLGRSGRGGAPVVGVEPCYVLRKVWERGCPRCWRRARGRGWLVDLERFELSTSSMPWKRAPNCATGPQPLVRLP